MGIEPTSSGWKPDIITIIRYLQMEVMGNFEIPTSDLQGLRSSSELHDQIMHNTVNIVQNQIILPSRSSDFNTTFSVVFWGQRWGLHPRSPVYETGLNTDSLCYMVRTVGLEPTSANYLLLRGIGPLVYH